MFFTYDLCEEGTITTKWPNSASEQTTAHTLNTLDDKKFSTLTLIYLLVVN